MMGLQEEAALVGRKKVRGLRREGLLGMKTEAEQSETSAAGETASSVTLC